MSYEPVGFDQLQRRLDRMKREADVRVQEELQRSLRNIEVMAKRDAPVRTGELRDSIHIETEAGGLSGRVGTRVPYAVYMEFGRRHSGAKPFLYPAFYHERPALQARLIAMLREVVRGETAPPTPAAGNG